MAHKVRHAKIVATPTESTWSQAYSTLNLYIVLSIKGATEDEKNIVAEGKELFERMQREYFSLDEKNLKNIKQSVEDAIQAQEKKHEISVVLATITENVLYIIIAEKGQVILKRAGRMGSIAEGTPGEISAFSGELKNGDIIILETNDFSGKIPLDKLNEAIEGNEFDQISENIAPIIHAEAIGTEASIILEYQTEETETTTEEVASSATLEEEIPEEETKEEIKEETEEIERPRDSFDTPPITPRKSGLKLGSKKLIIIAIVILIAILVGSVFFENGRRETARREATLNEILGPAQKKFEEADALVSLNKTLALDEFNSLKEDLDSQQGTIKAGTAERKKLDEFIGKVESKIGELGSGSTLAGQKIIYDKSTNLVTFKDNQLVVADKDGKITLLDSNGSAKDDFETKNSSPVAITENETGTIYVMGESGITQSTKTGTTTTSVKSSDAEGTIALDTFGSNLYGLTKTMIDKYAGGTTQSDYLKDEKLSDATSMAIDSSIFVIDDGSIRKFTKGAEDTFSVSGLKTLSNDAELFTSVDYDDLYVLDPGNSRIIAISKSDGSIKNQYASKDLSGATSFAVDETGKKIYVVISNKLYSFDL